MGRNFSCGLFLDSVELNAGSQIRKLGSAVMICVKHCCSDTGAWTHAVSLEPPARSSLSNTGVQRTDGYHRVEMSAFVSAKSGSMTWKKRAVGRGQDRGSAERKNFKGLWAQTKPSTHTVLKRMPMLHYPPHSSSMCQQIMHPSCTDIQGHQIYTGSFNPTQLMR